MGKKERGPINIVVVDDSATVREALRELFNGSADVRVVGVGNNGLDAVSLVNRLHPDVVLMDISMPKLDGFEATKRIMREAPTPIVLITSSKVSQDMDLSFKALRAGALTVVDKPVLNDPDTCNKIVQTVRLMADVPVVHHWRTKDPVGQASQPQDQPDISEPVLDGLLAEIEVVGIAVSTGGPSALVTILGRLPKEFPVPILVVQHISDGFTEALATWLRSQIQIEIGIANPGEKPRPGKVYLAPDDHHLQVGALKTIELTKDAPYKGLRPSANNLFSSLAKIYGPRALGIVLTGMGDDGAMGAAALHASGGLIIAQDEQSSAVYGMPREVKMRNVVNKVLNLEQIAVILKRVTLPGSSSTRVRNRGN